MSAALIADVEAGNLRKRISEQQYKDTLEQTYEELKAKYGDISTIKFEPEKHLKYYSSDELDQHKYHSTRRLTMEELGLTHKTQISPIGVSDPFPLFTEAATDIMKMECLQKEVFLKYARTSFNSTSGMDCIIRHYAKVRDEVVTPFIYQAWTHPKTIELISTMAGVELEIVMECEIAHVNIGVTSEEVAEQQRKVRAREQALSGKSSGEDIPAIVGWHYDSPPFVCVLMLSDTTNMIGGETYLRMGDQKIAKVPGPQKGSAAVLQGRLIQHLAPKPLGTSERITMVTSFRAKDPNVYEGSVLSTVKPEVNYGSRYHDFYPEWVDYRARLLSERLQNLASAVKAADKFDKKATIDSLKSIEAYLRATYTEMEVSPEEWATIMAKEKDISVAA